MLVIRQQVLKSTQQPERDFKDVFTGIGCFDGMFSLLVKQDSKPYQAPFTDASSG